MNWYGSGLITMLIYASFGSVSDNFALLTESGQPLLTEDGQDIDIEH